MHDSTFQRARVKLTLFYTIVTMTIVFLFSMALYTSLEQNLNQVINDSYGFAQEKNIVYEKSIANIEKHILIIDCVLLLVVVCSGYAIAGRTLQPIRENMESQKKFLADASHDLRTPLAIMKSESQVLLQSSSSKVSDYSEVVSSNIQEINKMTRLVDDLLIVARSESTNVGDAYEMIDLQKLLDAIIKKMVTQSNSKNITLTTNGSGSKTVKGNKNSLTRVFQNILQNAINYTPESGSITVKTHSQSGNHVVTITDTGVGISVSDLPHVFDRFYKAEHSRNDTSGSGLGLSIAKQIIDAHGGTIAMKSAVGEGTVAIMEVPIA